MRAPALIAALTLGCAPGGDVVAAGVAHACDLRGGVVRCWGEDGFGQRGLDGARAEELDAGGDTTCARVGERVRCVGQNHHGQLGDGTLAPSATPRAAFEGAAAIGVGFAHACAVDAEGAVWCWGWNGSGQAGEGSGEDVLAPQRVDVPPARRVVAGFDTSCALLRDGAARCWGGITVEPTPSVRDVAIGVDHVCVLTGDAVTCHGAPPGGARPALAGPLRLPLDAGAIAAGGIDHVCVTDAAGGARCFGKNEEAQLGAGDFAPRDTPSDVVDLPGPVTSLAVGDRHTCAVSAGQTWCWGWNDRGQLGDDGGVHSAAPIPVP